MGRRAFSAALAEKNGLPKDRYPETKEEVETARRALEEDFYRSMSLEDQEKLLFDIHGLPTLSHNTTPDNVVSGSSCGIEGIEATTAANTCQQSSSSTPEQSVELLEALNKAIGLFDAQKREAYDLAYGFDPAYVRNLQPLFLKGYNLDVAMAADQCVQHFENKRGLFCNGDANSGDGEDTNKGVVPSHDLSILARDIRQSDLSDEDMQNLEKCLIQVLPSRDSAGRVVMFCAPGDAKPLTKSNLRAYWYFQQSLSLDDTVQEYGIIQINWCLGRHGLILQLNEFTEINDRLVDGSFVNFVVEHYCYDNPALKAYAESAPVFSDERNRHRYRAHFGSKEEVLFKLQTFGIVTDDFPIDYETQNLKFDFHKEWLEALRKREEAAVALVAVSSSTPSATLSSADEGPPVQEVITIPRRYDVLFGRGCDTRVHPGNIRAKHLVETRFEEYEVASKQEKTRIAQEIVNAIKQDYNGRFLKALECDKSDGESSGGGSGSGRSGGWVEVDDDAARYKVAHFFRRRRGNVKAGK